MLCSQSLEAFSNVSPDKFTHSHSDMDRSMSCAKSRCIVAVICALAAWIAFYMITCGLPPRLDGKLHATIGKVLAQEAITLLGPQGKIVLVTRDTQSFPQPAIGVLTRSFQRVAHRARAALVDTHEIQLDPLRPVEVPPGDFYELIRRAPEGSVIVSLMGPPVLTEEQYSKLGKIKPKVIAFCSGNLAEIANLQHLMDIGILHAAVVSRPMSPDPGVRTLRGFSAYDHLYSLLRAKDRTPLPGNPQRRP